MKDIHLQIYESQCARHQGQLESGEDTELDTWSLFLGHVSV